MKEAMNFKDVEYAAELLAGINKLRLDRELCDVVIKVEENTLPAHKVILSAASPYFNAMFNGNFPESKQKEIAIHGIDPDSLVLMMNFLYTGHLEITSDNALNLLNAACFLQIQWVQEKCCEFIEELIDTMNCLRIRIFADRYSCDHLRKTATEYIVENFEHVFKTPDFVALELFELEHILTHEALYDNKEDLILSAILRWIHEDPDNRSLHLPTLIKYVHPLLVSRSLVNACDILTTQPECEAWRLQASGQSSIFEWNIFILDKTGKAENFFQYDVKQENITKITSLPEKLFGVSLCGNKHFLYAHGGSAGRKSTANCFRYNIQRKRWAAFKPMLLARSHHSSCILNGSIYVIGGTGLNGATDNVERLDLTTGHRHLTEPMLKQRSSMGAAVYEGSLYVMGGENERECLYSMERYDPREGCWTELVCMDKVNSYCSSVVVKNYMYCAEGLAPYMERYDFRANSWELIKFKENREFYDLFAIENELYGLSGEGIYKYDPIEDWNNIYHFPITREWDTAVPINVEMLE